MKNTLFKAISLTLITLLMLFSFTGCFAALLAEKNEVEDNLNSMNDALGDLDFDDEEGLSSVLDNADNALNSAEDYFNKLPDSTKPRDMEEYLSNSSVKSQLDSQLSSMQTSEYSVTVEADGNELIYLFKYKVMLDASAAKPALEKGMSSVDSYYTSMVGTMQAVVTTPGVKITIKYLNADGTLIYSKTYR